MNQLIENLRPYALLIARVIAGYMFLLHGTAKFFEFPVSMTGGNGAVAFFSIYGVAAVLELVGGIFIILGLFTRLTAFILSGQMAVAYFMFHASAETLFQPMLNKGELAALYSLFFLVLIFTGAGKIALDYKIASKN
ncbi:membrane protein [Bibersteinia trehalosi Y31]|uniref:Membrane protein n=1 Tax=Bibersteinia trehalosi Y31 TaxID=1261658 RepID=A0A179CXE1_BIBTR|nr:DoxX family protein [Bibersteinia trehalosi]OAQ14579.1 membrane protein [Bibersteinia trehalosi Y31]